MRVAGHWLAIVVNEMKCSALPRDKRLAQGHHDLRDGFVRAFRYGVAMHERIDDDDIEVEIADKLAQHLLVRRMNNLAANVARDHELLVVDTAMNEQPVRDSGCRGTAATPATRSRPVGDCLSDCEQLASKSVPKNGAAVNAANPKNDRRPQVHPTARYSCAESATASEQRGPKLLKAVFGGGYALVFDAHCHALGEPCFDFVFEPADHLRANADSLWKITRFFHAPNRHP